MLSNNVLWPAMGGIALAVGIGVQMGESTIGSINPIHFQGAAPPVQAIDATQAPPATSAYAQAYGWEQGNAALQAEGAPAYQDFDYLPRPMVRPAAAPVWQEPAVPASLSPWPPGQVSSHPEVERYTDYPIEAKPADPAPAPAPAPEASPETTEDKAPAGQ